MTEAASIGEIREKDKRRFMSKIHRGDNGCWLWLDKLRKDGYGHIKINGKMILAHRFSWYIFNNNIPTTKYCLHRCDNRACVNPDHLFLGTQEDNMADMTNKGRSPSNEGDANPHSKISERDALDILRLYSRGECAARVLSDKYHISETQVYLIYTGVSWGFLGDKYGIEYIKGKDIIKGDGNGNSKLSKENVVEIRELHKRGVKISEIVSRYGMSKGAIYNVVSRRTWRHLP